MNVIKTISVLLAAFAFGTAALSAQVRVPNEEDILDLITDADSPYYYPSLMLRYEAGDTSLTLDDYFYLYYGYAYQDSYKPLEPIEGEAEVLAVLERNPEPGTGAAELLQRAQVVMKSDPFSPKNINFMAYACAMMGDSLGAQINADRLNKIFATITSTGTGLKENSPWHVLWFSHAGDVMASMGKQILNRQVRTRSVEYISVIRDSRDDPKGYFFDFGRMYWKKPENHPSREKQRGGFELNGVSLGRKKIDSGTPAR